MKKPFSKPLGDPSTTGEPSGFFVMTGLEYRRTKRGVGVTIYNHQKSHSKTRGHLPPSYTLDEFLDWLYGQDIFYELFSKWAENGYDRWDKPSCDRLDDYKPYSFDNIQLVTWRDNNKKEHIDRVSGRNNKQNTSVYQYGTDGKLIKKHHSICSAARHIGASSNSKVSMACNGLRRTCSEFVFRKESDGYFGLNGNDLSFISYNYVAPQERTVRVLQYSKDGTTLIKSHRCINTAGRLLNTHSPAIRRVCNGRQKSAGGFHWKYDMNQKIEA